MFDFQAPTRLPFFTRALEGGKTQTKFSIEELKTLAIDRFLFPTIKKDLSAGGDLASKEAGLKLKTASGRPFLSNETPMRFLKSPSYIMVVAFSV